MAIEGLCRARPGRGRRRNAVELLDQTDDRPGPRVTTVRQRGDRRGCVNDAVDDRSPGEHGSQCGHVRVGAIPLPGPRRSSVRSIGERHRRSHEQDAARWRRAQRSPQIGESEPALDRRQRRPGGRPGPERERSLVGPGDDDRKKHGRQRGRDLAAGEPGARLRIGSKNGRRRRVARAGPAERRREHERIRRRRPPGGREPAQAERLEHEPIDDDDERHRPGNSAMTRPPAPAPRARTRPISARSAAPRPKPPIEGASPHASARVFSSRNTSGTVQNAVSAAATARVRARRRAGRVAGTHDRADHDQGDRGRQRRRCESARSLR